MFLQPAGAEGIIKEMIGSNIIQILAEDTDLWVVGDVEEEAESGHNIREHHPVDHQTGNVAVLYEVAELNPVDERGDRVQGETEEQGERGLLCGTRAGTERLQENDGSEEDRDHGKVEALIVREAGEVVDDDPHVGPVEGHHDGDVVQPLPGTPGGVAGHRVEQRT